MGKCDWAMDTAGAYSNDFLVGFLVHVDERDGLFNFTENHVQMTVIGLIEFQCVLV